MKRVKAVLSCLVLLLSLAGVASAAVYDFEDMIDEWGCLGADAVYLSTKDPLQYTHDINDDVDFAAGDYVTEAWLELDFTNDRTDDNGSILGLIKWDYREYAKVGFDGDDWVYIGEVDNGQYDIELDIDWLNEDGFLDVTIYVKNSTCYADAWLDHSRLYGQAATSAVPEPATLTFLLLGTGLIGLARTTRKKLFK